MNINYKMLFPVMVILIAFSNMIMAAEPGITIASPLQGTEVEPGSTVHIVVEVDPALEPQVVSVSGGMFKGMFPQKDSSPPYEFDVKIPSKVTGPLALRIVVNGPTETDIYFGPKLNLIIKPTGTPVELTMGAYTIGAYLPLDPDPIFLSQRKVSVYGTYADGIKRKVSHPGFGVTYTSSNTGIATVDESGQVTPVSPGIAYITAVYKGLKTFTQVSVNDANNKFHIIEHTDKVSLTASGFRREPIQGLYIQQLTLRNDGTLPIPKPVNVILSDLPPGVSVMGGSGTKTVTPLGSRSLDVEIEQRHFWPPGATATVNLEFSNDDGRPITYTARIFTALIP